MPSHFVSRPDFTWLGRRFKKEQARQGAKCGEVSLYSLLRSAGVPTPLPHTKENMRRRGEERADIKVHSVLRSATSGLDGALPGLDSQKSSCSADARQGDAFGPHQQHKVIQNKRRIIASDSGFC